MVINRRAFLAGVGSLGVAALAGCTGGTDGGDAESSETESGDATGTETDGSGDVEGSVRGNDTPLEITEQNYFERGSVLGVSGTVENTGNSAYSIVTVHMSPMEEQQQLGKFYSTTAAQNVDQLGPGEEWHFAVSFDASAVKVFEKYEVWVTGKKA
ncbi:FxLYD domain-containing protein [Halogeometricum limi]|uniref:Tat (Twin-arginine translocation) pathway signal sequence n=1 Tax=Halogeometricum limi TaxID=555875 RepID=A0A1I6FTG8_9EURY|nr:FxLYD domain-containing protein [Halogeometricum limi]SFR33198.1 hypothetical protein SAMN04488124_0259 [Halogeometricum limi]